MVVRAAREIKGFGGLFLTTLRNWLLYRMADCQDCKDQNGYEAFKATYEKLMENDKMRESVKEILVEDAEDGKTLRIRTLNGFAWFKLTEDQIKKLKDIL